MRERHGREEEKKKRENERGGDFKRRMSDHVFGTPLLSDEGIDFLQRYVRKEGRREGGRLNETSRQLLQLQQQQ